jgi:ferric-dicitrate binding protein FerR (iron transport regulator)
MKAELERWTSQYLDGTISADGMASLNRLLEESAAARREFADWLDLDAALGDLAPGYESAAVESSRPFRLFSLPASARFLAAAAAIALLATGLLFLKSLASPYATVVGTTGVTDWGGKETLRSETITLSSGALQLLTPRGAEIVIEAPATFRFDSGERLHLFGGRLAADVPPAATGFTVVTPDGDAVDLGTRFGVDVPAEGDSEIHVFEGEVIATRVGGDRSLRTGDAFAMNRGNGDARELRSGAFIQSDELPALDAGLAAGQEARSRQSAAALSADPNLISLITFEDESRRPGVYRLVQGRWPGSRAAEFVEAGDHLRLDIGEDRAWPQLTLAAWVRLDRLGAPYQSLLHTDGWSKENPGQVHWMLNQDATMRLALRENLLAPGSDEKHGFPDSRTAVLPEQGRWVHLAVVYDSEMGTVRFYLNGRLDDETHQSVAHPARLGPAQIGNWDQQDRKLSGRIDQLVVLGRAMSDAEIFELHEAGTPYR